MKNVIEGEITVDTGKKIKLQEYDKLLKKFQYHEALNSALKCKNVEITITVIEELIDRNALKLALLNRSEEDLELILNFILWKIRDPKLMHTIIYMFNLVISYYMIMFGENSKIDKLFKQIFKAINDEIEYEKALLKINAKIDSINNIKSY